MRKETNISCLIDDLTVLRDSFRSKYDARKKELDKEIQQLKNDFRQGKRLDEEIQFAKEKFAKDIDLIRKEANDFIKPNIESMKTYEMARVRHIDVSVMEKLQSLSNIPISGSELSILKERFAPNNEFWPSKMISYIAEKNCLNPEDFIQTASLDTKISILKDLEKQTEQLIDGYNGELTYSNLVLLADSVLMKAENTYLNGFENANLKNAQLARRVIAMIRHKNPTEQGIALMNAVSNADPQFKTELFYEMKKQNTVPAEVRRIARIENEYQAFINGELSAYEQAKKAIKKVVEAENIEDVKSVAETMIDNAHFAKMLEESQTENFHICEYLASESVTITE